MARTPDRSRTRETPTEAEAGTDTDSAVATFLDQVARTPKPARGPDQRGRLIFALDATMSRQPTWDRACQIQAEMFEATREIGGLDVQLVYYRGFGECRAGKWQPDAAGLARLMSGVQCLGGLTQIGRVLKHAEKAAKKAAPGSKVGALVFVGDAFEEDIDAVCDAAGRLGLLGVPAFMFQEGGDPAAERAFREIARLTGGAWCPFDLASADQLKQLLSAVAVYATGGVRALEDYGQRAGGEARLLADRLGGRR